MLAAIFILCIATTTTTATQLSDCDPLDPHRCYLPFPNNFWLRKSKVAYSIDTFPYDNLGQRIDPVAGGWNDLDGYSPVPSILTYVPNINLELSKLPRIWNESASLASDCGSILLDTVTGNLLPHWVELDHRSDNTAPNGTYERATMLWPTKALVNGRRYVVAFRSLMNNENKPIEAQFAFKALRDNITTIDPDIELRRGLFKDIFMRLQKHVNRNSLYLAWDFTIASQESIQGKLIYIRDDALKRSPTIRYTIYDKQDNYSAKIFRKLQGSMQIPLYLNSPLPNSSFVLDPTTKLPVFQGYAGANFTILIPHSLVESGDIGSVMQYGHGLFGSRREVEDGYLQDLAQTYGHVLLATDWWGLDESDAVYVAVMLATDLTQFKIVPDRCQQGMLNALLAMRLLTSNLASDPLLIFKGKPVVSASSDKYYYGNSQGGILGTVYMGVSQQVKRGTLGVAGGPYSLLLPRSVDFEILWKDMYTRYPDNFDRLALLSIIQQLWARADPSGYMAHITSNPPPNTPEKQVLMQYGVGDAQVTYLGAYTIARSIGAKMFTSNVKEANQTLYGFEFINDKSVGNTAMIVGWKFPNVPDVPQENIPPNKSTDTHDLPRKQQTAQEMMEHFFKTGDIINTCNGTCIGIGGV